MINSLKKLISLNQHDQNEIEFEIKLMRKKIAAKIHNLPESEYKRELLMKFRELKNKK